MSAKINKIINTIQTKKINVTLAKWKRNVQKTSFRQDESTFTNRAVYVTCAVEFFYVLLKVINGY